MTNLLLIKIPHKVLLAVNIALTDASGQANNGVSEQATNGYESEDHDSVLTAQTSASEDPTPKATQSKAFLTKKRQVDKGHGLTGGGSSEQQVRYQLRAEDKEHHQDNSAKKSVNKHHMVGTYVPDTFINTSDFEEEASSKATTSTLGQIFKIVVNANQGIYVNNS